MVLQASDAAQITDTSILIQSEQKLNREIFLTEAQIRRAGRKQKRETAYDATILGNPFDDPNDDANLTDLQKDYRDYFVTAGYIVSLDPQTGWWRFDWSEIGADSVTTIYSIRTVVTPGAISDDTITLIEEFFANQNPAVTATATIVTINGGDIDETEFGATTSTFYEYHARVGQAQSQDVDFSADLTTYLEVQGAPLGYAAGNVKAYRVSG